MHVRKDHSAIAYRRSACAPKDGGITGQALPFFKEGAGNHVVNGRLCLNFWEFSGIAVVGVRFAANRQSFWRRSATTPKSRRTNYTECTGRLRLLQHQCDSPNRVRRSLLPLHFFGYSMGCS